MPKAKETLDRWKLPKDLPEGLSIARMERTVGKRPDRPEGMSDDDYAKLCKESDDYQKGAIVEVLRVAHNGEAVRNAIELLSEIGPKEDFGVEAAAVALNGFFAGHVTRLEVSDIEDSASIVPPLSEPRYINPFEAVTSRIAQFQRDEGRMPTPEEYQALMDEMSG